MIIDFGTVHSISGLVAEYIVAIDVTRARFPADAICNHGAPGEQGASVPRIMRHARAPLPVLRTLQGIPIP